MRCTLKDGVFFKPKKKKSLIKSKREQRNDIILPPILRVKQSGKGFVAVKYPEITGTWSEVCNTAQSLGYSGVREDGGLLRKKTFPKVAVETN